MVLVCDNANVYRNPKFMSRQQSNFNIIQLDGNKTMNTYFTAQDKWVLIFFLNVYSQSHQPSVSVMTKLLFWYLWWLSSELGLKVG